MEVERRGRQPGQVRERAGATGGNASANQSSTGQQLAPILVKEHQGDRSIEDVSQLASTISCHVPVFINGCCRQFVTIRDSPLHEDY